MTIKNNDFENSYSPSEMMELEEVKAYLENKNISDEHVWTIVDGDDGGLYALAGWHFVNRLGYIVTVEPPPHINCDAERCAPNNTHERV